MKDCQNCGNVVTDQFAKVYGDNSDTLQNCPDCIVKLGYRKEMIYRGGCATQDLEELHRKIASKQLE